MRTHQNLTHIDEHGTARMVNVSGKPPTQRKARASGKVLMAPETLAAITRQDLPKGDVLGTARIAGILAAKKTDSLIPLCHRIAIDSVNLDLEPKAEVPGVAVSAEVTTTGPTGVEMEALTAVAIACLTVYDMIKAIDRNARIDAIRLTGKSGGSSGAWESPD